MLSVVISGPRNGKVKNDIEDKVLDVSYFCMRQLNILRFNGSVHVKIWNDLKGAAGYCAAERVTINNRNEWEVVIDVVYDKECMAEKKPTRWKRLFSNGLKRGMTLNGSTTMI